MEYDVNTPAEYLEALDEDWRKEKLLELRELIFEKAPDLNEGISYKMLCYKDERGVPFHLNAQRGYVSFESRSGSLAEDPVSIFAYSAFFAVSK
ncbi:MAG: hypothetical protein Roseis2KO_20230 [Roseivirga sp.]